MPKYISNAQNFEDIYLFRAYRYITNFGTEIFEARIVDIGAWEPVADNVSAFFIELGWFANLIEPQPGYYEKLIGVYGNNSNVEVSQVAVSSNSDNIEIYIPSVSTGWASVNQEHALYMQEDITVLKVQCMTLDQIHTTLKRDYAILKIDAEENEQNILNGWTQNIVRPLLICIENRNSEIERQLKKKNYTLFFFDGINMYFVLSSYFHFVKDFNPLNLLEDNAFVLRAETWLVNNDYTLKEF